MYRTIQKKGPHKFHNYMGDSDNNDIYSVLKVVGKINFIMLLAFFLINHSFDGCVNCFRLLLDKIPQSNDTVRRT